MNNARRKYMDDSSQNDIIKCAYNNDVAGVSELVDRGVDINTREERTAFTPLHIAVGNSHFELFRYLISHSDVDLWAEDRWKRTPAELALDLGDLHGFVERITQRAGSADSPKGSAPPGSSPPSIG